MKLKRVKAAEYRRAPGGVFERLSAERPRPAIYYYEYRRRPSGIQPSQLLEALKRAYPVEKIVFAAYPGEALVRRGL